MLFYGIQPKGWNEYVHVECVGLGVQGMNDVHFDQRNRNFEAYDFCGINRGLKFEREGYKV